MKTAVEFIESEVKMSDDVLTKGHLLSIIEQAKAMEKEQIEKAFNLGYDQWTVKTSEQYYNETFKPKQR